jgi:hypothetical protein
MNAIGYPQLSETDVLQHINAGKARLVRFIGVEGLPIALPTYHVVVYPLNEEEGYGAQCLDLDVFIVAPGVESAIERMLHALAFQTVVAIERGPGAMKDLFAGTVGIDDARMVWEKFFELSHTRAIPSESGLRVWLEELHTKGVERLIKSVRELRKSEKIMDVDYVRNTPERFYATQKA